MSLTKTNGPLVGVQEHLAANVPAPWGVELDDPTFKVHTVVIQSITPPRTQTFAMGGPEKAQMLFQVTLCGETGQESRLAADLVRDVLTGVDRRNRPLYPLLVDGYVFDNPTTTADGHAELAGGIHTWAETFNLAWQYRPGVTPPS